MRTWTGSGESGNFPASLRPLAWKAALLAALLLAPLVAALYALLRAPSLVLIAVLCVVASAEAGFYFWLRERSNGLDRMPPSDPQHLEPEKAFSRVLTLAALLKQPAGQTQEQQPRLTQQQHDLQEAATAAVAAGTVQMPDMLMLLCRWFLGADPATVRQGNVAELLAYGFYYKTMAEMEAAGLGHEPQRMVERLEAATGTMLPPGYQEGLAPMFHLWEPLHCSPRPLAFYLATELVALFTHTVMTQLLGFKLIPNWGSGRATPEAGGSRGEAAPKPRQPTSTVQLYTLPGHQQGGPHRQAQAPILFIHGVGAGLFPYLPFVAKLAATGIPCLCVKMRHVSMQLTQSIPTATEVAADVVAALDSLGVEKVCVVAHSFGTFIAAVLAQRYAHRLHSICLMDPVCLGVFLPNLLTNFLYRCPGFLASHLLEWLAGFASREVHVAATFRRRFAWSDVNLWAEDLPDKALIIISGLDDLIHVNEVRLMLAARPADQVMVHPSHAHADFLLDCPWQRDIIRGILRLYDEEPPRA